MTNLEKINELVGLNATAEEVVKWAYANRILVSNLHIEEEFVSMENSVYEYYYSDDYDYNENAFDNWYNFLKREYVPIGEKI